MLKEAEALRGRLVSEVQEIEKTILTTDHRVRTLSGDLAHAQQRVEVARAEISRFTAGTPGTRDAPYRKRKRSLRGSLQPEKPSFRKSRSGPYAANRLLAISKPNGANWARFRRALPCSKNAGRDRARDDGASATGAGTAGAPRPRRRSRSSRPRSSKPSHALPSSLSTSHARNCSPNTIG